MSRYAWEHGTIKLPRSELAMVKRAVREANNRLHEGNYNRARDLWREEGAKLRRVSMNDRFAAVENLMFAKRDVNEDVVETLWLAARNGRAPRRDDVTPARATSVTTVFRLGEASIAFRGAEAVWTVPENNHACEEAREHPVGVAFFRALGRVRWTRGSGGEIVGNDEYNRDADYAGGGGNYIVNRFGPVSARERRAVAGGRY